MKKVQKELLGHASMDTTSGFYAFVTWEMVSEAVKKANEGHLEGEMLWKNLISESSCIH